MCDAERKLILESQKEWDRRKDLLRVALQDANAGLSVDDANEEAGKRTIREIGDRPGGGGILAAVVPLLTLLGFGLALAPGAMAALTAPEILTKLRTLYDGLRKLGVGPDVAGVAVSGVKGLVGMDKINAIEGIRIARATSNAVFDKIEEGLKNDGKIDKGEMVSTVTAAIGAAWAEVSDGDTQ